MSRLQVRPRAGTARVTLRGTLPDFPLVDAAGALAAGGRGALAWRVRFGQGCAGTIDFVCSDDARDRRRRRPR
jgi:hypothetical protein